MLVTAASRQGSTLEIAEAIAAVLRRRGIDVTVAPPSSVVAVGPCDAAIVGSAVYGGRWLEPAVELVHRHARELRSRPVWLFSSGPVGDPERAVVQRLAAEPREIPELMRLCGARSHRIFAGKLAVQQAPMVQRLALRALGGAGDWRRWEEIDDWANAIADDLIHAEWYRRLREETAGDSPAEGSDRP